MATVFFATSTVYAHDLWLTTTNADGQQTIVVNFGESDRRDLVALPRLFNVDLIDGSNVIPLRNGKFIEQQAADGPVLVSQAFAKPGHGALLSASYDSGYWVTTPQGTRNVSKRLYPQASASRWAVKFAKTLLGPGAYKINLGQEMELTALEDPFTLAPKQILHVRLQLKGMPLPGAKLRVLDGVTVMDPKQVESVPTNVDGIATVTLNRRGLYVLAVEYDAAGTHPDLADKDEYNSTLAFELK